MSASARVVVVGAGIVGSSVAYHLAQLGWSDLWVVDKGELVENDGSTSHAPGGVVALSHNKLLCQMALYGTDLYHQLPEYSSARKNYHGVGLLEVAATGRRWQDLKRLHGESKSYGVESHLLSPTDAVEMVPYLNTDALVGSLFVPKGATVASSNINGALQRASGARFLGGTTVLDVEVRDGRVAAVITDHPEMARIGCDQVVLCTNIWAPVLGEKLGVSIPLLAYEHQYVITSALAALAAFEPSRPEHECVLASIRDLDATMYFRQHWNSYGVGSYWHRPRPVSPHTLGPTALRPFTSEDFYGKPWDRARELLPVLDGAGAEQFLRNYNGMFAFSVDGMPIIGEAEVAGLWVATAAWLTHAAGVGKSLAEWMTEGETEWDMRTVHLRRFAGFQTTPKYVSKLGNLNYAEVYEIIHPRRSVSDPRNLRLSPFHPRWSELGAEFTVFAGIELPNWFESNRHLLDKYHDHIPPRTGWAAENWSPIQGAEHLETRHNVGLYDLTGLSIIEVSGRGAVDYVNHLCSNDVDKPVGSVVYTLWLTSRGGVRRDLTVARLAGDRFWMFVGEGSRPQDLVWVRRAAARGGYEHLSINDVSDSYAALGLWGPNARRVLEKVTNADLSGDSFPYFSSRWIDLGFSRVLALRISYAGELGWELHLPVDMAEGVWDALWDAGRDVEMVAGGMGAFDSLRLEKGYRLWGGDMHTEYDAYEAGLGWTVQLSKPDFIGKSASVAVKAQGTQRKLTCLTLDDQRVVAMGYEPILDGDRCVGHVTSANHGYSIGKFIVYGYLPIDLSKPGTKLEVEYLGERFAATVATDPQWDPAMERLRS